MPERVSPPDESVSIKMPFAYAGSLIWRNLEKILAAVLVITVLYFMYLANYPFFHTTVEGIVIIIASAIFLLAWKSRQVLKNNYFLFLGIAFLFFAIITFLHTLAAPGTGIFQNGGAPLSSQFWIAGQFMLALSLLVAPFFIRRNMWFITTVAAFALIDLGIIASILFLNIFPATFINGVGSTLFKNVSEYVISLVMIGAIVLLYRNRESFDRQVLISLLIAFILTIATELTLTFMASSTDVFSFTGHMFRLFSFYFFFTAIIEVGLQRPYDLLYRELRESEEQYRSLFENLTSGALLIEPITDGEGRLVDLRYLMANPSVEKHLGKTPVELVGRCYSELFPYPGRDPVFSISEQVLSSGEPFKGELLLPATGRYFDMAVYRPGPGRLALIITDITARKQAGEALRESEERFRRVFERSPFGIAIGDLDGRVIGSNPALESMLGYPKEELLNMNFARFTDNDDVEKERILVVELLEGKRDSYEIDKHYVRKDGRIILVRLVGTVISGPGGKPMMGLAIIEDVTEQRQAGEALRQALVEKEILLSEIHHRVKNNLAAFISLLSLEGSTEDNEAGRELKKNLQNRARSMALIHETLYRTHQFSEVDMDVYLTTLVGQIVSSYHLSPSIRTVVEAKGVALDLARATPAGLIVNELVTNSLKHAFPKDTIANHTDQKDPCTVGIQLTKENGLYQLTVYDNGVGLPAGFDPLIAKSLGLKLVNFLAKHQLRAEIEVNTEKGMEFIFRFKR